MFNLIIFGPPGSGKGTQSANIAKKFGLIHLSTGELFRYEIENGTPVGNEANSYISKGQLVPDEITLRLLFKHASKHVNAPGIIFDGFPRTLNQAKLLDRMMDKKGLKIHLVIGIKVESDELVKRIKHRSRNSDRNDDTESVIYKRMEIYRQQTHPVMDYYRKQGKFETVSGMAPVETVFQRICKVIKKYKHNK
ncbi:MAG: adenylate kinase [Bacteroidales bacterium]|nr:adenylate kinase [Bacteroidales bacterium]